MVDPATSTEGSSITSDNNSLLNENRQQGNSIALPRFHSSVYHGGVIRQIVKVASFHKSLPKVFSKLFFFCLSNNLRSSSTMTICFYIECCLFLWEENFCVCIIFFKECLFMWYWKLFLLTNRYPPTYISAAIISCFRILLNVNLV